MENNDDFLNKNFNKNDWNHFHNCLIHCKRSYKNLSLDVLKHIFSNIDTDLQLDAIKYGMNDTSWRESFIKWIESNTDELKFIIVEFKKVYLLGYLDKFINKEFLLSLSEGMIIDFEMPSFCSGDYQAKVFKDELGLYIYKRDDFFKGCRDYNIITENSTNTINNIEDYNNL